MFLHRHESYTADYQMCFRVTVVASKTNINLIIIIIQYTSERVAIIHYILFIKYPARS